MCLAVELLHSATHARERHASGASWIWRRHAQSLPSWLEFEYMSHVVIDKGGMVVPPSRRYIGLCEHGNVDKPVLSGFGRAVR